MTEAPASTIEFQRNPLFFVALAGYLVAWRINQSAVVVAPRGAAGQPDAGPPRAS